MQRILTPIHWKILECIFLQDGFVFERQKGDHRIYSKPGCVRPVVIPTYREIDQDIIRSNMRSAKMDTTNYFKYLAICKDSA